MGAACSSTTCEAAANFPIVAKISRCAESRRNGARFTRSEVVKTEPPLVGPGCRPHPRCLSEDPRTSCRNNPRGTQAQCHLSNDPARNSAAFLRETYGVTLARGMTWNVSWCGRPSRRRWMYSSPLPGRSSETCPSPPIRIPRDCGPNGSRSAGSAAPRQPGPHAGSREG